VTTAVAIAETDKLAKLIRLIFASDKPGEITAAVAAVRRLLAAADLDGHWLSDRLAAQPISVPVDEPQPDEDGERSTIWFCFHRRHQFSPRDRQFIETLTGWRGPLSTKQRKWLTDICDKLAEVAA
jgi:DNA-binding transcriptional LysR family regulator